MDNSTQRWKILLAAIPLGVVLNLGPGWAAKALHAPLFLDSIGTIMFTILCGWRVGAVIGVFSFVLGGLLDPTMFYFILTEVAIVVVAGVAATLGSFRNMPCIILTGVALGFIAALVSAPAVALAFDEASSAGLPPFTAFLAETGGYLQKAFMSSEVWIEPMDKILQCAAAVVIIKALPKALLNRLNSPASFLKANGFI